MRRYYSHSCDTLMKFLVGAICAILLAVFAGTEAQAYCVTNNSPVVIPGGAVVVRTTCGTFVMPPLPPGATWCTPMLPPSCTVLGILYRGVYYPMGYSGPVPPPNPPSFLTVASAGATFS